MARTFLDYQSLPSQSGTRSDISGPFRKSHLHDPMEGAARNPHLALGNETLPRIRASQGQFRGRLLSQQDKQLISYQSPVRDDNATPIMELDPTILNVGTSSHFADHQIVVQENLHTQPSGQVLHNNNATRIEKKRKVFVRSLLML